jgi:hypothetical protein
MENHVNSGGRDDLSRAIVDHSENLILRIYCAGVG